MDEVATLRRFNRCFTQRIGVLAESYLDSGRPLGPSRLLFEIGAEGARIADLRRGLGLDSGYLSRLLRQLEQEEAVTVSADPIDGRQRIVHLTAAGRREWRRIDRRSEDVARHLVEPLSARQRAELTSALATAERLLRAATVHIDVVDPRSPAAQSALQQYFGELDDRFRSGFDPDAGSAADVILITEKDAVKCRHAEALRHDARLWFVPVEAVIDAALADYIVEKLRGFPTDRHPGLPHLQTPAGL